MESSTTTACACDEAVTDAERYAQLDDIITDQKERPGALIPVLRMAQLIFGYLPTEAIKRITIGFRLAYDCSGHTRLPHPRGLKLGFHGPSASE